MLTSQKDVPGLKKNYQFLLLFASQALGYFGRSIYFVALPLFVLERTGSTLSMGATFLFSYLPLTLGGPPVGLLVDHFSRRNLLIACSLLYGATLLLLPTQSFTPFIYAIALINSLFGLVIANSVSAMLPSLVHPCHLSRANSLYMGLRSGVFLVGAFLAYFLIGLVGKSKTFYICSLLTLLSGVLAAALSKDIPVKSLARKGRGETRNLGLLDALKKVFENRYLKSLTAMHFFFIPIFGAFEVYLPAYSEGVLHQANYYTLLSSAIGTGMLLGSLLNYRLLEWLRPLKVAFMSLAIYSLCILILAQCSALAAALGVCFVSGFSGGFGFTTYEYLRQRIVSEDFRGRVFTIMDALVLSLYPLGTMLTGYLAQRMNMISLGLWISAAGLMISLFCYPLSERESLAI